MLKKWIGILLILTLVLTMFAGCSAAKEEESASADTFVEGEDRGDGNIEWGEKPESGKDGISNYNPSAGDGSDSEPQKPQNKPGAGKDDGGDKDETADNPDESVSNEPEDPYADTPISKTPAKTADGVSYFKENELTVVSYNVRCANDPDGHSVEERKPRLEKVLNDYDADLMGFQEVTLDWEINLLGMLSKEYDFIVEYRNSGGGAEANPIFFKKSKFKLLDSGTFWLSETPEEESKGWGADHYRICTWVKLQVRQTGAIFHYFNTHVDYKPEPQVPSAEMLIKRAKSMAGKGGVVLTGDFNLTHSAPAYETITSYFGDTNMLTVKDTTQGTLPSYGKHKNGGNIIDFCFVTPKAIKATSYKVMTDMVDGKYVSDHFGVCSKIIIL